MALIGHSLEATIVDIGGGYGQTSCAIAKEFPKLKFVVQDLPDVIAEGKATCPPDLQDRVAFQEHDFFEPQPIHDADIYMFKAIIHDWADEPAAKLLRSVALAMKPEARILLVDGVKYEPGVLKQHEDRSLRAVDLTVWTCLGTGERELDTYRKIISDSDSRLEIRNVFRPRGAVYSIIEIGFKR
ncbi:MAG: hypothetical protein M1820_008507 [Bogoriella megaspora]|nr:MAG: hypothetical protein M1820_008507 [Bogoriella megaspora]